MLTEAPTASAPAQEHPFDALCAILDRFGNDPTKLIPILRSTGTSTSRRADVHGGGAGAVAGARVQVRPSRPKGTSCGSARRLLTYTAVALGLSPARVYGVATFYAHFTLEPKGKYIIRLCDGTACHVKAPIPILEAIREAPGARARPQSTTPDMLFTVETVSCLGACGLAPVVVINEQVHGQLTPEAAVEVIEAILASEESRCALSEHDAAGAPDRLGCCGPPEYWQVARTYERRVVICAGTGCVANGALKVHAAFVQLDSPPPACRSRQSCAPSDEGGDVRLSKSGCQGFCQQGPLVTIEPDGILYTRVRPEDVAEIMRDHPAAAARSSIACSTRDPLQRQALPRHQRFDPLLHARQHARMCSSRVAPSIPRTSDEYIHHGGYARRGGGLHPNDAGSGLRGGHFRLDCAAGVAVASPRGGSGA
jgi:NADH-quinone oxidoreductase subunit E